MRRIPPPASSARRRERLRGLAVVWLAATVAVAAGAPAAAQTAPPPAAEAPPGRQIAVLPLLNRTGEPAPLADLRQELAAALAQRGLSILDPDELERFMRRHRLRYTGGLHGETARALKAETGARAALITSLDLYQETDPPKVGITSRLVSAADAPRILWMGSEAESGDESPGLLGLGLISEPDVVRQRVIAQLADSLTRAAEGAARVRADRGPRDRGVAKRFRPKIAYAAADGGFGESVRGRIAVLPLANESTTRYAGEILTDQLVHHLVRSGARVVEPGVVRQALLEARQIQPEGPSVPQVDVVRAALDADLILYGEVAHYQEAGAGTLEPVLGFSLRAIATATRQVVWSSVSHTKGNDGVFFFDVGQIATAHRLSTELSRAIVVALAETGGEGGAPAPPEETVSPEEETVEELAILAGDADTLTRLLDAARSARDRLAAELAAARHEAEQARTEAEKLERRLAAIDKAGSDSQARFAELAGERDALLAELSEADRRRKVLEDSVDSLEDALAEARARPAEAEAALAASEAEKSALNERLAAGEAERVTVQERLATTEAKRATLEERLAASEAERVTLSERLATTEGDSASLDERLAAARTRMSQLETEVQSLQGQLAEARRESEKAEARLAAAEAERGTLAERLAAAETRTASLEGSVGSLETALAETRREAEAARAESRAREAHLLAQLERSEAAPGVALPAAATPRPAPGAPSAGASLAEVEATVRSWADAWAGQRVGEYLARYSSSFEPPGGLSREAWERQRRERLTRPEFIELTLESLRIEALEPGLARVSFRQTYRSDTYGDVVSKTLDLHRVEGGWAILREQAR